MYFIRYEPLKSRLRSRSVSDREALPYLVITLSIYTFIYYTSLRNSYNFWNVIETFISVAIVIGGIFYAYRKNGGMAGFDLIQKFVVLGWVVFFRFMIVANPVIFFLVIVGTETGLMSQGYTGPYEVLCIFLIEVVFYQRIGKHIGDTAIEITEELDEEYTGETDAL